MAKLELTDAYIRSLKVDKRTEITDLKETGLLLRVFPTGKKTFAFRMRGDLGKIQNVVIGAYPDVKLSAARADAAQLRTRVKSGEDVSSAAEKVRQASADQKNAAVPTLEEILVEYEIAFSSKRKTWERTEKGNSSEAERRIKAVFEMHLHRKITEITLTEVAHSMATYVPKSGKKSANGQVSRARSYLKPVFDWCAHANKSKQIGRGRPIRLNVIDLGKTYDPASDDPEITGRRYRALDHHELGRVLPLLYWPAPRCLKMKLHPDQDYRPAALRFLLLTCARREELVVMKWHDFKENTGLWHKPYVKTISGPPKQQSLPLSDAAIKLLKGLPNFDTRNPEDLVFPNATGGLLGNWGRITSAVQRESETSDWHRHDLRRTGSTIMKALGIASRTIDDILAHNATDEDEGVSTALKNYLVSVQLLGHIEDPQKVALDKWAEALEFIENSHRQ